mgnify:CR=1 FL=1|jgi:sec-independent protein translocase protein TatA
MLLVILIGMPGLPEWILILGVVLLLFGGKKIPELMRGLGNGIREFNSAKKNVKEHIEDGIKDTKKSDSKENTSE